MPLGEHANVVAWLDRTRARASSRATEPPPMPAAQ
jgi:hypothetical protein